ncbi:hypothetical protein [Streptomyces sp. H27-C3]|uniref:hypothetical protein n=1 Tax=Streptomyces sp. H27-C3 TaxID=3046305 RepID=UPI0024BB8A88|nr:hypothetical protein [Streptomyces sp. H27-C3]MDJ0466807.1 hypothetical protein [Streptomyces sp. H27-C3]
MELQGSVEVLPDAVTAAGRADSGDGDTLDVLEVLVAALGRLGPEAEAALAPGAGRDGRRCASTSWRPTILGCGRGAGRPPDGRHRDPVYWINRDARDAEQLWLDAQEGRDKELADLFAALPLRAMIEALDRRHRGEKWRPVLEDLTCRHRALRRHLTPSQLTPSAWGNDL